MRSLSIKILIACAWFIVSSAAATATETITYFHVDLVGSPVAATDQSGNLLWKESYRPYGERLLRQDTNTNKLWYAGKPSDPQSGLSYFGARWYDPVLGRFMGVDPVEFKEHNLHSFNRYAYGNNNPYRYSDPDGREPWAVLTPTEMAGLYGQGLSVDPGSKSGAKAIADAWSEEAKISAQAIGTLGAIAAGCSACAAERTVVKEGAETIAAINPKIYRELEKQLERDGARSIHNALKGAEKSLQKHKDKLPSLEYKSQVEGTIRNVERQVATVKQFIKDKGL